MKFNSAEEMKNLVLSGTDIYNKNTGAYVFLYNDMDSICEYYIDWDEAVELQKRSEGYEEYWGAYLGWGGGIIDSEEYIKEDLRSRGYSEEEIEKEIRDDCYTSDMYFEECYSEDGWILCSEVKNEIDYQKEFIRKFGELFADEEVRRHCEGLGIESMEYVKDHVVIHWIGGSQRTINVWGDSVGAMVLDIMKNIL